MKQKKRPASTTKPANVALRRGFFLTAETFARGWWLPLLWLTALILLVYGACFGFGLTNFDDQAITGNPMLSRWSDIPRVFEDVQNSAVYRPLYDVSIIVANVIPANDSLVTHHSVSIILHILACWALFLLMSAMHFNRVLSLLVVSLFALHPLVVQSVAWIPGRHNPLALFFMALSVLSVVRYLEEENVVQRYAVWLIAHCLLLMAALLSGIHIVMIPLFAGLYAVLALRHKVLSRHIMALVASWILLSALYHVIATQHISMANDNTAIAHTLYGWEALQQSWRLLPELWGKMTIPYTITAFSQFSLTSTLLGVVLIVITLLPLLFTTLLHEHHKRLYSIGLLWSWIALFILCLRYQVQHFQEYDYLGYLAYVPQVGWCLMILALFHGVQSSQRLRGYAIPVGLLILFGLGIISHRSLPQFSNMAQFWQAVIQQNPNHASAYYSLGSVLFAQNDGINAERFFERALQLSPDDIRFLNAMAAIHVKQGKTEKAGEELRRCLSIDSTYSEALYNLGCLVHGQGQVDEAEQYYRKAIRHNPVHGNSYVNLLVIAINHGNTGEALRIIGEARSAGINLAATRPDLLRLIQSPR